MAYDRGSQPRESNPRACLEIQGRFHTRRDKPFHRSPKGTTMRRKTLEFYADEIDAIYSDERMLEDLDLTISSYTDLPSLKQFVRRVISKLAPHHKGIGDNEEFFTRG